MTSGLTRQLTQQEHDRIVQFVSDNLADMQAYIPEYENLTADQICSCIFVKKGIHGYGPISVRLKVWHKDDMPISLQEFVQKELGISLKE